jgi:hypothetical protein
MAQAGFTPIQLYFSTTAAAVPTAGNLANGELAINITDGKLYYKNNSGTVTLLSASGGGPAGGSNTQVQFNSSGVLAGSANMTFDGTTLTANALTVTNAVTLSGGTANGVAYLNGSKVVTSGSALTFDGTNLKLGTTSSTNKLLIDTAVTSGGNLQLPRGGFIGFSNAADSGNSEYVFANSGSLDFGVDGSTRYSIGSTGVAIWSVAGSEQMRLTSTGLGIGTSSPLDELDVVSANATYRNRIRNSGANEATLLFQNSSTGTATNDGLFLGILGGMDAYLWNYENNPIIFGTNNTERMRLDSSGNLGLGVTPSAWSGFTSFDVGTYGSFYTSGGFASTGLGSNAYYNGTNWIYKTSAPAFRFDTDLNKGFAWYSTSTGTAGDAITFTQAMTLDASGNLGIGETNPTSRLHVSFTSNSVDNVLQIQQKGNNTASGLTLAANDNNGAGYNFIRSLTTGGTTHWQISGGVATSTLAFSTGGSERMRIDSSGNVGIGTTSPSTKFNVVGSSSVADASVQIVQSGNYVCQLSFSNGYGNREGIVFRSDGSSSYTSFGIINTQTALTFATAPYNIGGTSDLSTDWTERVRIDSSGNMGIGTSSPSTYGRIVSSGGTISLVTDTASQRRLSFWSTANGNSENAYIQVQNDGSTTNTGEMLFATRPAGGSLTERARITAGGNFFVGATTVGSDANYFACSPGNAFSDFGHGSGVASGISYTRFLYAGGVIGSITQSGTTAVLYNTTSDQRLKENIQDAENASTLIDSLQVRQFDWKADGSHQRYGFIAQELATVAPEAVHQPADPEEMMAVDYSKLVPMLVKEIQSLRKRLADAGI